MMPRHIELNPVSHLTVGTLGLPGQRTFFLQGSKGGESVSLVIEKEQAAMLASSFEELLSELETKHPVEPQEAQAPVTVDMRLREPVEPLFRVGNMGLGYNEETSRVVLVAYELVEEEEEEPNAVSFWASRAQVKSLISHTVDVIRAGRPICGNCGGPIDPEGHFCPRRNGHKE